MSDDWTSITDPAERKRIQNRLAQRARRMRLASRQQNRRALPLPPTSPATCEDLSNSAAKDGDPVAQGSLPTAQATDYVSRNSLKLVSAVASQSEMLYSDPMSDARSITMHGVTTYQAFATIARVLDLNCVQEAGFNIRKRAVDLPSSIAPTVQQQLVPHKSYVDMLPWSALRDRLLRSPAAINETEFTHDMISTDLIVWGSTPWDPMAWEVGPIFAARWWFLMDDTIMRTSNFWRAQRGETPLPIFSV